MRKIILDLAVTLDGLIEGPNGEIDWLGTEEEMDFGEIISEILEGVDSIFYGRISYEKWGNYYPPDNADKKIKDAYNLLHSKTKYVFSTTALTNSEAILINSDIEKTVHEILQQPGENIWLYGGGKLITTFVNLGLVDVYRLAVHPVILGTGKLLFEDINRKVTLQLKEVKSSGSGVVFLNYTAV